MIRALLLPVAACVLYFVGDKLWLGDVLRDTEPCPVTFKMRLGILIQASAYILLVTTLILTIQ